MVMTSTENMENLPGSTKSCFAKDENPEQIINIDRLFSEGYKHFLAKEFEEASDKLGEANQLAVALYGQFAPECFKPHYYYGLALIEIARNESLIVNAPGGEQSTDKEDDEDEEEAEAKVDEKKPADNDDASVDVKSDDTSEAPSAPSSDQNENSTSDNAGDVTHLEEQSTNDDQDEAQEAFDEEEVSTEMLAWESLEVARKICEKNGSSDKDEWMDKRIEVLIALGDCMVISEEYLAAIRDFNTALELQKKLYGPNERRTAEVLYNIACCYRNMEDFKKAAEYFEEASNVITNILTEIKKIENSTTEDREKSDSLKKVVEDIQYNIQDARDSSVVLEKKLEEKREIVQSFFMSMLADNTPINEITTLIRKGVKRSATDSSTDNVGVKPAEHSANAKEEQKDDEKPTGDVSTVKKAKVDE